MTYNLEIPTEPHHMNECFANAFNSGDVHRLNALFEPSAKVVNYHGEILSGYEAINEEHLNLLKLGGKMTSTNKYCVVIDDISLLRADWVIETLNEKSEKLIIKGSSSEIVRKQDNNSWLYIVDHPFGANQ